MSRLSGKVALVTGGARGLGAATVRAFVEQGAKVVFGDVLVDEGEALASELGPAAAFVRMDVREERHWNEAIESVIRNRARDNASRTVWYPESLSGPPLMTAEARSSASRKASVMPWAVSGSLK